MSVPRGLGQEAGQQCLEVDRSTLAVPRVSSPSPAQRPCQPGLVPQGMDRAVSWRSWGGHCGDAAPCQPDEKMESGEGALVRTAGSWCLPPWFREQVLVRLGLQLCGFFLHGHR